MEGSAHGGEHVAGRLLRWEAEDGELRAMEAAGVQLGGWRDRVRVAVCDTQKWLWVLVRVAAAYVASQGIRVVLQGMSGLVPPLAAKAVPLLFSTYHIVDLARRCLGLILARLVSGVSPGEEAARVRRVFVRVEHPGGALCMRSPSALESYLSSLLSWPSFLTRLFDRKRLRSLDERVAGIYLIRTDSLPADAIDAFRPLREEKRKGDGAGGDPAALWTEIGTPGGGELKVRRYEAFPSAYQGAALLTMSTLMYLFRSYFRGGEVDDDDPFAST